MISRKREDIGGAKSARHCSTFIDQHAVRENVTKLAHVRRSFQYLDQFDHAVLIGITQ